MDNARALLTAIYRDAIAAVSPDAAVLDALRHEARRAEGGRIHLIAIGKASAKMLHGAGLWLAETGQHCVGGVCIAHHDAMRTALPVAQLTGDHPVPGLRSKSAADHLGSYVSGSVQRGDQVLVLLSGGASALIGAPVSGLSDQAYAMIVHALLGSGLSIGDVNTLRRRLSRWGGGKLGHALQSRGARVHVLVVSDVLGNALTSIGSGPCVADDVTHTDALALVRQAHLSASMRDEIVRALYAGDRAGPTADVRAEEVISHAIVSSNSQMLNAVAAIAGARDITCTIMPELLTDGATLCGERVATAMLARPNSQRGNVLHLVCWGGEPLVILPADPRVPAGGRMQALALSAARMLGAAGTNATGVTILAAGTDGRDGATDAAGAVVDADTWNAIERAGRAPEDDLAQWESSAALGAAGALIPAFVSGTNVNDVVMGVVQSGD
jgi:glycerate 2-kinase